MTEYVAGFLCSPTRSRVALIQKLRGPKALLGKLNAIGGKLEPSETPLEAMTREFEEETGLRVEGWEHTVTLCGTGWTVRFFRAFSPLVENVTSMEAEPVAVYPVGLLMTLPVVPNLRWILNLSLDDHLQFPVEVSER